MSRKIDIKELTFEQLVSWLQAHQIAAYRAEQMLKWIYLRQVDSFDVMTDLSKALRVHFARHFTIGRLKPVHIEKSLDGTQKYLFELVDGKRIESVLIPERDHYTLCISSQVGCALGCGFCLTARVGLQRNLTRGEIIAQVRDVKNALPDDNQLTNIVFMGMGEPLANYENVAAAIGILTDNEKGLCFANRRVTVSTAGVVPRLKDLGRDTRVNLAISLNATDNQTRNRLMPVNRKYPLQDLLQSCRHYPLPPGRRITFEYILIKGVNDSAEDAHRLAGLLRPIKAKINLIPFNPHEGCDFERPRQSVVEAFRDILVKAHYTAIIRHSKGQDISAACGQLRANY